MRGFTLIELMITLAVIGVALALFAPSYTAWNHNTQIRTAADSMLAGIKFARAEALKQNTTIRFQLMDTLTSTCVPSASGTNWVISRDDATGACDVTDSTVTPFI